MAGLNPKSSTIAAIGALIAVSFVGLHGCGPEGAGTIKVSPDARASMEPPGPGAKHPLRGKAAKAKELEEEAKKKDPKRY